MIGRASPPPFSRFAQGGAAASQTGAAGSGQAFLWAAPAFAAGALLYFQLKSEPSAWIAPTIAGALLVFTLGLAAIPLPLAAARAQRAGAALLALATLGACGFACADWRTGRLEGPIRAAPDAPVRIEGWVRENLPSGPNGPRFDLQVTAWDGPGEAPRRVRLSMRKDAAPSGGRFVACKAVLRAPDPPQTPGGFDAGRFQFFAGIDYTGFALGACRPAPSQAALPFSQEALRRLEGLRAEWTQTIARAAPGSGGAIAAALVTGDQSLIERDELEALRDSGLAHLLAVSGLNMALAAGVVFYLVHLALAAIPALALRFAIRKWAAAAAIFATILYFLMSGGAVSAQRAFVMTMVGLAALLLDRPVFTMRGLSVAGLIILALTPEAVLSAGFQMSFAATAALIAAFEAERLKAAEQDAAEAQVFHRGWMLNLFAAGARGLTQNAALIFRTSFVAGLATAPFSAYHFGRFAIHSLAANLAAMPILTFIVAPAGIAAAALSGFGGADPALWTMAWGLERIADAARLFAQAPGAVIAAPPIPGLALGILSFGLAAWSLGGKWIGRLGVVAILGAALWALLAPRPVLVIDRDGKHVLARVAAGDGRAQWAFLATSRAPRAFVLDRMRQSAGAPLNADFPALAAIAQCERGVCAWRTPQGLRIAILADAGSTGEAPDLFAPGQPRTSNPCDLDLVIDLRAAPDKAVRPCAGPPLRILSRADLAAGAGLRLREMKAPGMGARWSLEQEPVRRRPWSRLARSASPEGPTHSAE